MALFGIASVTMASVAFVRYLDLLRAGHATQPQCYPDESERRRQLQARAHEGGRRGERTNAASRERRRRRAR